MKYALYRQDTPLRLASGEFAANLQRVNVESIVAKSSDEAFEIARTKYRIRWPVLARERA